MEKFDYLILDCNKDGWVTVEYMHKEYGKVIRSFYIPLNKSKEIINRVIKQNLPMSSFVSRKNNLNNTQINIDDRGTFEVDLEQEWYDIQVEIVESLKIV